MNELHLFAGAGGGVLAGHLLGHRCIGAVEREPYAQVLDGMTKAKTPEALDLAADLIKNVANEAHRAELNGKYLELKKGMEL